MTKEQATEKVKSSLSEGAQLITPKGKTYEEHLQEVTGILFQHIIEPKVAIVTSACFPEYDFEKYKTSKVWAIAKMGNSWLLTLEEENEFALGFGDSSDNIMMHGFSSSDAIGEWCA